MYLLVTGGAGFIGSNVIQHIIDRPEIEKLINLDCLTYAGHLESVAAVSGHAKYQFEKIDLRDKPALLELFKRHPITHVLHLAAESHVDRSITGPGDFIHTNIVGTFNLLEACRGAWTSPFDGRLFHHVSTDEVYGSLEVSGSFTEESAYAPNSPYSASKAASDFLVRAYQQTYGLPTIISHSSNDYGPFQYPEKLIPVVIQSVLARKAVPIYGNGLNVRDWLHVCDHAEALWQLLLFGRVAETYNIGARNEWSNIRLVELICDIIDELAPHLGGQSRKLINFVQDRPGHDHRYAINPGKIERELGWKPARSFETGLREMIRWYLENQHWVRAVVQQSEERRQRTAETR